MRQAAEVAIPAHRHLSTYRLSSLGDSGPLRPGPQDKGSLSHPKAHIPQGGVLGGGARGGMRVGGDLMGGECLSCVTGLEPSRYLPPLEQ